MQQLRPGLWTWTAPHPSGPAVEGDPDGWDRAVRSYAYDSGACLVLIDPMAPPSLLEGLVESKDVAVLLTLECHVRSAADCVERFGATVHVMKEAVPSCRCRRRGSRQGDTLPGGVVAQLEVYAFEAIFWIPAERAIVAGDALLGGEHGLRVQPESWHDEGTTPAAFRDRLRPLLDLPIELVLPTHGDPVLAEGREAVRAALET